MASAAEREIRDAVVAFFHAAEPRCRVVHELPLSSMSGNGRADLGLIFPDTIYLVEIKSEKDKLDRLEKQFGQMVQTAHGVLIVAHQKWIEGDGLRGQSWMNWSHRESVWSYPAPLHGWQFERYRAGSHAPNPYRLLGLLWADELRTAYRLAGVMAASREMTMHSMTNDLQQKLTGRQVREVVCKLLRARAFSEADPPIPLELANA